MGFYTSLSFYRPTRPPKVTGAGLATFIEKMESAGVLRHPAGELIKVKFGKAIDQDEKDADWVEPVPGLPVLGETRSIKWDIYESHIAMPRMLDLLRDNDRPIYRAFMFLGGVPRAMTDVLQTTCPDDGEKNVWFDRWSLEIGPVKLADSDNEFFVGWMRVAISGNGSLRPWTPRDLVEVADRLPEIQAVKDLCRRTWPVDPNGAPRWFERLLPSLYQRRIRKGRTLMGKRWPYPTIDLPWDWFWGAEG